MSISILNRGAAGGLKPELTVRAIPGSTLDLLQNDVVVATYTLGENEDEHTFTVGLGTYTVRGTLGGQTNSVEAVIDVVRQYTVPIYYTLWLYRAGDECEDVTGGWGRDGWYSEPGGYATASGVKKEASAIYLTGTNSQYTVVAPNNMIDFTYYSKLYLEVSTVSTYQSYSPGWIALNPDKYHSSPDVPGMVCDKGFPLSGSDTIVADIVNVIGSAYLEIVINGNTNYKARVHNVWLE